jgi:hypothetical protein
MAAIVGRRGAALLQRDELIAEVDEGRRLAAAAQAEDEQTPVEGERFVDIADDERDMIEPDRSCLA